MAHDMGAVKTVDVYQSLHKRFWIGYLDRST